MHQYQYVLNDNRNDKGFCARYFGCCLYICKKVDCRCIYTNILFPPAAAAPAETGPYIINASYPILIGLPFSHYGTVTTGLSQDTVCSFLSKGGLPNAIWSNRTTGCSDLVDCECYCIHPDRMGCYP